MDKNVIKFEKLKKDDFTYSDIHLDISEYNSPLGQGDLFTYKNGNDLNVSYDEYAVLNSIKNIFNTRAGQRPLNPEFGLNLSSFLFRPINKITARMIARKIINNLEIYEPRVKVSNVHVEINPDDNTYEVFLYIRIPKLSSREIGVTGILNPVRNIL
jgi:phage baseplate assembly protein W